MNLCKTKQLYKIECLQQIIRIKSSTANIKFAMKYNHENYNIQIIIFVFAICKSCSNNNFELG